MKDLSDQLNDLIPKNLDDIIRRNRSRMRLQMASSRDLELAAGEVPHSWITGELGTVYFYKRIGSLGVVEREVLTLVGYDRNGDPYHTSSVIYFDHMRMRVLTQSRSVYSIKEISYQEPPEDLLMMICAMFWKDGAGEALGIPYFFY